ncbi:MAG: DUF448 domain-containing protein [Pacificimonas sp.]
MRQPKHEPERTCILTRRTGTRDELIRLALGPGGDVRADLGAKAPGRGAWLSVDSDTLKAAQAKGQLKGALARAFKGDAKTVPDDLADSISIGLERAAMDRIGLEMKAGHLAFGFEKVLAKAKSGAARLLLHAADAGADGIRKVNQASHATLQSGGHSAKSLVLPVDRAALSMALGQGNVVHVAVMDAGAATRIEAAARRWQAFSGLVGRNGAPSAGATEGIER